MKKHTKNLMYDRLHKGGVICCMGLTIYGAVVLGRHAYTYIKYMRPEIQAAKAAAQDELLSEGASDRVMKT